MSCDVEGDRRCICAGAEVDKDDNAADTSLIHVIVLVVVVVILTPSLLNTCA